MKTSPDLRIFNGMFGDLHAGEGSSVLKTERLDAGTIKIGLVEGIDPNSTIPALTEFFENLDRSGISNILFDMENVLYPGGSFIALLIAETVRMRNHGGELRLINLADSARNHFAIFSPMSFLSVGLEREILVDDAPVAHDDISATRVLVENVPISVQIPAMIDALNTVNEWVADLSAQAGLDKIETSKLKIAVYECCMNVIEHGYRFKPDESMSLEFLLTPDEFRVTIVDWGEPFDPVVLKPYNVESAFAEKRRGGFGMYIIKRSVDDIKYRPDLKEGNRLTLVKKLQHVKT